VSEPRGHWLAAGFVGRPHGLDGSFRVREPAPELLRRGVTVLVEAHEREIVRRAGDDAAPIVRLDGCGDRAGAEALRGQRLLVRRDEAPALEADEWWAEDLEGCAVIDGDRPVGVVRRLVALPSCEALEVERPGADALLIPLVRDAVRSVDATARRIDVDLGFVSPEEAGG
jgi:16S rRNA processing protein RimM